MGTDSVGTQRPYRSGATALAVAPSDLPCLRGDTVPGDTVAVPDGGDAVWLVLGGFAGGLVVLWLALLAALWIAMPDEIRLREAMRLLPDVIRLLRRLATDRALPRGVRVRLVLLLAYLATPVDLVPDVIPVLGHADDAVVVALVLRSVVRAAGDEALDRHWPGTPEGLAAVRRLIHAGTRRRPLVRRRRRSGRRR